MLVNSKEILSKAKQEGYAVPAPDFIDLDSARSYVQGAEAIGKPIILSFAQAHHNVISLEEAALIGKYVAQNASVPIVLHLDHGTDIDFIKKGIGLGFTSVMIDASMDTFEENIRKTKEVVDYAHKHNVTVEAEIGHVGSGDNYENHDHTDSIYTEVEEAKKFVEQTNVDSLAVSIGTAHGKYKGVPQINFERLEELKNAVHVPLVLHGGSGSGDDNLKRCAHNGISKINIFTDFLVGAMNEINEKKPTEYFDLKVCANDGMKKVLNHYFDVFAK